MRRAVLVAVLGLAVLAGDASASACRAPAQHERADGRAVVRTAVRVCDVGAARSRVVAHGVRRNGRGTEIQAVSASGRHVVWSLVEHTRGGRERGVVVLYDRVRRSVVGRREVARRTHGAPLEVEVRVTGEGVVGWLVTGRLVAVAHGPRARTLVLDRGVAVRGLGLEFGATLRWDHGPAWRPYADLRRRPRPGCAALPGEHVALAGPDAVVLATSLTDPIVGESYDAACLPRTGTRLAIARSSTVYGHSSYETALAVAGSLVLVATGGNSRYGDCWGPLLRLVDVRDARVQPMIAWDCEDDAGPVPGQPLALSAGGVFAWVRGGRLLAVPMRGTVRQLDPGPVTDLTIDGRTVRWRVAGADRSVTL